MWPFSKREASADVGNRVGDALEEIAAGKGSADPKRTASVAAAAGLYSRAFAGLSPSVADSRIDAAYLATVGYELVLVGVSYRLVERERLVPVVDVQIGSNPAGAIFYKLKVRRPGREAGPERTVPEDQVVAIAPPGMGISRRSHTINALALIEARLERDASLPSFVLQTQKDVAANMGAKAAVAAAEAFSRVLKLGSSAAPVPPGHEARVLETHPLGLSEQRRDLERSTLASLGVPAELLSSTGGASIRESFRQFCRITIAPLADLVALELGRKLGMPDYKLSTARLGGHDVSSISRALKALTDAGMSMDAALEVVGLE